MVPAQWEWTVLAAESLCCEVRKACDRKRAKYSKDRGTTAYINAKVKKLKKQVPNLVVVTPDW